MSKEKLPEVYESDMSLSPAQISSPGGELPNSSFSRFLKHYKVWIVILVAVILFGLFVGMNILQTPFQSSRIKVLEPVSGGKIVLIADKKNLPVGDTVKVTIKISTGGHTTDGMDVVLNYDPNLLETAGSSAFSEGEVYDEYPIVSDDAKVGIIEISGIAYPDKNGFNGTGTFGVLSFKTKKSGNATIAVNFEKGLTTDSNIIETKTTDDILTKVYNLDLQIGSRDLGQVTTATSDRCEGYSQICWDGAGGQGTQECQGGKKKDDVCIWDPNLTTACDTCEIKK